MPGTIWQNQNGVQSTRIEKCPEMHIPTHAKRTHQLVIGQPDCHFADLFPYGAVIITHDLRFEATVLRKFEIGVNDLQVARERVDFLKMP
jgi:hypothetical protein